MRARKEATQLFPAVILHLTMSYLEKEQEKADNE